VRLFMTNFTVLPEADKVFPFFTSTLLKVWVEAVPFIACAPEPWNKVVPVPGVYVPPLLVQLPNALILAPDVSVPEVRVVFPLTTTVSGQVNVPAVIVSAFVTILTVLPEADKVLPFFTSTLLKVWVEAEPFIACSPEPWNKVVPVPGVYVPPLLVQLPNALILAPDVSVPEVRVAFPLTTTVSGQVNVPAVIVSALVTILTVLPEADKVFPFFTSTS